MMDERAIKAGKGLGVASKDPSKGHFYVSIVKSLLRMVGCGFLMVGSFGMAGLMLLIAEGFGIMEELV